MAKSFTVYIKILTQLIYIGFHRQNLCGSKRATNCILDLVLIGITLVVPDMSWSELIVMPKSVSGAKVMHRQTVFVGESIPSSIASKVNAQICIV